MPLLLSHFCLARMMCGQPESRKLSESCHFYFSQAGIWEPKFRKLGGSLQFSSPTLCVRSVLHKLGTKALRWRCRSKSYGECMQTSLWQNPSAPIPGPCGFEPRRHQLVLDLRGREGNRCTSPRIRTYTPSGPHCESLQTLIGVPSSML